MKASEARLRRGAAIGLLSVAVASVVALFAFELVLSEVVASWVSLFVPLLVLAIG